MSTVSSVLLGLVQGITEFLPISSSGHLVIFQSLLGFSHPPIFFDIMLHVATLCAVLVYFRSSLATYFSIMSLKKIVLASIPAAFMGLFLYNFVDEIFSSTTLVSIGLLITGSLLLITKKIKKSQSSEISYKKAFNIGLFQALALFPGISRSGSTIFGGLLNQVSKKKAFEFSFILSIPAILGALTLQIISQESVTISTQDIAGFITAFLSGLVAIRILDFIINNDKLYLFGYYCLLLGSIILSIGL